MHYIKLLGSPRMWAEKDPMKAQLTFAITTDLSDTYLAPEEPIDLRVVAHVTSPEGKYSLVISKLGAHQWKSRMTFCKITLEFPQEISQAIKAGAGLQLSIEPSPERAADTVEKVIKSSIESMTGCVDGLIVPVYVGMSGPEVDPHFCKRILRLNNESELPHILEIQEELGESMARHIWDGGFLTLCILAGCFNFPALQTSEEPLMKMLLDIINREDGILELGCGVGSLGTGLCALYPRGTGECTILMTDLEAAQNIVRSNMGLLQQTRSGSDLGYAQLQYENLDWEDGKDSRFGPLVQSQRWGLIMLSDCTYNEDTIPHLVDTLSAIHRANMERTPDDEEFTTHVFVATKPRHDSERMFFSCMYKEGWREHNPLYIPLPVLGLPEEPQSVELYLFYMSS
jgi:hypothetical protein